MKKHVIFLILRHSLPVAFCFLFSLLFFTNSYKNSIVTLFLLLLIAIIAILCAIINYKEIGERNNDEKEMIKYFYNFRLWLTFIPILGIAGLFLPRSQKAIRILQIGELADEYLKKVQGFDLKKDPILILFNLLIKLPSIEAMKTFGLFHEKIDSLLSKEINEINNELLDRTAKYLGLEALVKWDPVTVGSLKKLEINASISGIFKLTTADIESLEFNINKNVHLHTFLKNKKREWEGLNTLKNFIDLIEDFEKNGLIMTPL